MRKTSLFLVAALTASCAQIIGLSDYEKVDGEESGGSAPAGGKTSGGGRGGASSSGGLEGIGGDVGPGGDTGDGGVSAGGKPGTGGKAGTGGAPPVSGGRAGTGGTSTPGSGGRAGTGGAPPATGGAACVTTTVDLLADNGNFDGAAIPAGDGTGPVGTWYQGSTDDLAVVQSTADLALYGALPHSGTRAAHLGEIGSTLFESGIRGRETWLGKIITVPPSVTAITASCYTAITSEDPPSSDPTTDDDYLQVWFWDPATGEYPYIFVLATEFNAPLPWKGWSDSPMSSELPALAGRTLAFELYSFVNDAARTDFYVDTCSLKVTYCK